MGYRPEIKYGDPNKPGPGNYHPYESLVIPKSIEPQFGKAKRKSIADVDRDKANFPPPGAYSTITDFTCYGGAPAGLQNSRNNRHHSNLRMDRRSSLPNEVKQNQSMLLPEINSINN
jgi:hypothetical protein